MTSDKILSLKEAQDQVTIWKETGQKIVFTNGCFDIVHLGHVDYLEKAAALGDKMIVGLNTDSSVSRIKGTNRPVVNEESRSRLIAALDFTDAVILFDEPTPESLIRSLCPDILVKGDDYDISNIVGADFVIENGGEVKTIELVKGYSTSAIIEKIKKD